MTHPVYAGRILRLLFRGSSGIFRRVFFIVFFTSMIGINAQESLKNREQKFEKQIMESASDHGVDPLLIKAIIFTESSFIHNKTGSFGEIGLMQIRLAAAQDWAKEYGVPAPSKEDMFDPGLNIEIGTWYIARALKRWYENPDFLRMALAEYNAGRTRLLQWMEHYNDDTDKLLAAKPVGKYADKVCSKYFEYTVKSLKLDPVIAEQPKIAVTP